MRVRMKVGQYVGQNFWTVSAMMSSKITTGLRHRTIWTVSQRESIRCRASSLDDLERHVLLAGWCSCILVGGYTFARDYGGALDDAQSL